MAEAKTQEKAESKFFGEVTSLQANQQPHVLQHCRALTGDRDIEAIAEYDI